MDGNTSETPIISDAYALTYVQEMKGQLAALAQQIRVLESQLAGVDANLSTNLDGLQSVMQGQAQALTNETTVRAKLVQGVADDVAELREQHSTDHAYLIGEMERHHDEYDAEAASIRASLSEERSERAQGDAEVLAAVQEQADQAQWYYDDTKAHLAKHDQALDDTTWDSTELTFDNDDYTFGWSILSAAQEWETQIGEYLNQIQKLVDSKLRNVEGQLITATDNATKALENTEVEKLLEILQGQVGIDALDSILWGRFEGLEDEVERERRERLDQIRREAEALTARIESEATALHQKLLDESVARADALAEEAARTAEMAQFEAEQRVADIMAAAEAQAAALAQETIARNQAIAREAQERALAIQAEAEARAIAVNAETAERVAAIQKEVQDRSDALLAEANARKAEIQAERDARVQAINDKAAALTTDYTARIQQLNTDLKKTIKDVQDGVTASVAELESADASIISSLNAYKVSNNASVAAVVSRVDTLADAQSATATTVDGLVVEVDGNAADISNLAQVVASNEKAVAEQISGLTTALEDAETSLGAQIQDAQSAITTLDSSTATRFEQVNAELESKSKEAMDAAASAKSIAESAVTTNAAQATDITNLKARMSTTEGNVAKKADATTVTALSNEVSGLGESVTANSNQLTELAASIQIANQEIGSVKTGVANAQTTANSAVSANNALASRVDALSAMLTDLEEGAETNVDVYAFSALKVDVENLEGRVESNTSDITSIESTLNSVQQGVSGNTSAISQMQTTQTNQGKSIAQLVNDTTVLKNDMTTVKEGLSTKADASAMSELLTRVEDVEGVNTSQGSALTNLQNSLDTTNANVVKKADASALNTLETKVTQVEGKATTNANNITSLTGRVSTVEGDVAKKADATALNNYYTKSETESKATTIAAGQVSSYDASLVIGGCNLYTGPNPVVLRNQTSAGELKISATQEGTIQRFNYLNADILDVTDLGQGDPTIASIEVFVPETNQGSFSIQFGTYKFSSTGYRYAPTIAAADVPKGRWVTLTTVAGTFPATATATGINVVFNLKGSFVSGDVFRWRNLMMEKATKASGFVESDKVIQQKIAANAQAISNTDTKVEEVEGVVTAHTTRLDKLTADLSTTDTKANTAINNAATAQSTANSGVTKAEAAASSVNTLRTEYEATVLELEKADQENTAAIAKTNTDLISAQTALSNADKALGNRIDGLTTTVSNNLSTVRGEIQDVADSVTTLEGNTNTRFTSLASELETVEGKADKGITNAANAQTTANTAVSKANANANSIVSLGARLGNAETALGTKASTSALNAVTADVKTLSDGYASNTSAIQKLQADMGSVESDLSTKATTSALNTTNTNVSKIDGRVTTNTNNLNALTSRMTTAEGNIAKKADTTALQNYYTKTEMEDKATTIAAGEVNKYKAGLFIGGRNLVVNESQIVLSSNNNTTYPISLSVVGGIRRFERTAPYSATLSTYCQTQVSLEKGKTYTGSVEVRPVKTQLKLRNALMPVTEGNVKPFSGTVYGPGTICPAGQWTRLTCTVTATADGKVRVFAIYSSDNGYVFSADTGAIEYRNIQIEEGEYATAFTTNESDIKASIDANAEAINTTDAKVQEVDGVVKSHTTSINKLTSDLATVDTKAGTAITNAATAQTTAKTAVTKADANATNISKLTTRMSTAEGNISKKADASVLSGYYTKNEADTAIAGKLNEYKASLVIGGTNLATVNSSATNRATLALAATAYYTEFHTGVVLEAGKTYTFSIIIEKLAGYENVTINVHLGTATSAATSYVYDLPGATANNVTSGKRVVITFTPTAAQITPSGGTARPYLMFRIRNEKVRANVTFRQLQVEEASVPSAWAPSYIDVQKQITANATAISNVYTKAETNSAITTATNSLKSQVDKNIAEQNSTINTWVERNKVEAAMVETMAAELVPHMAGNTELFAGVEIKVGYKGVITALAETDNAIMSRIDSMESRYDKAVATIQTAEQIKTTADASAASVGTTIRAEYKAADTATKTAAVKEAATAMNNALKSYTTTATLQQNYYTKTEANKAISAAQTTLKSQVTQEYGQAINAAVAGIKLDSITIPDTRSTNQTPVWYRSNYKSRMVNEFKTATAIGLTTAQMGQTYVMLTTYVYYADSSGGPIKQVAIGKTDDQTFIRYSTGSGSSEVWGSWVKKNAALTATVDEQAQSIDGVRALKTVTIDNNGVMSGYGLISDLVGGKVTSAFGVNADQFYVGSPSTGKKVFSVVNGTTVINDAIIGNLSASKITTGTMSADRITAGTIKANHLASKTITADKLNITSLSAVSGTLGTLTTYKDASKPNGARMVMTGSLITVYDDNNVVRVRLGLW